MLRTIVLILIVLWLLGWLGFHVGGDLIHLILVIAVIMFLMDLLSSRRGGS